MKLAARIARFVETYLMINGMDRLVP